MLLGIVLMTTRLAIDVCYIVMVIELLISVVLCISITVVASI